MAIGRNNTPFVLCGVLLSAAFMKALWVRAGRLVITLALLGAGIAHADETPAEAAAALRARYAALQYQLANNQFQKPLYMESSETSGSVSGNIFALMPFPFETSRAALSGAERWCDILMLHINTKYCRAAAERNGTFLHVKIGRKNDQPVEDTYPIDFAYRVAGSARDYLKVTLAAPHGPLSTFDYRVTLEATATENGATLIPYTYSYSYGFAGRLAMQAYLGTIGSDKVGFTIAGRQANGHPLHIGGVRGVVERNTMRYYLAIEAYLGAMSEPLHARLEKSLLNWFTAIERYPRQLHEMEQNEYLDMKRRENRRLSSVR